jgi:hypothetical protein
MNSPVATARCYLLITALNLSGACPSARSPKWTVQIRLTAILKSRRMVPRSFSAWVKSMLSKRQDRTTGGGLRDR